MSKLVESLSEKCLRHIIMHLEEYPPSYLSLLPRSIRKEILWQLPMADICSLEDTGVVEGIDMAEYWKSTFYECDSFAFPEPARESTQNYFEKQWNVDSLCLNKAVVYGQIFGLGLGFYSIDHTGVCVDYDGDDMTTSISLMYGLRKIQRSHYGKQMVGWSSSELPPRYIQYAATSSKDNFLKAALNCFRGDLPTYLYMEELEEETCRDFIQYTPMFKNLRVLGLQNQTFSPRIQELLMKGVQRATNLEALIIHCTPTDAVAPLVLDELFLELSNCPTFLRSMCLLKVCGTCDPDLEYYAVSFDNLKALIQAYLDVATNHLQLVYIEDTKVSCKTLQDLCSLVPNVDGKGKKSIELKNCKFIVDNSIFNR